MSASALKTVLAQVPDELVDKVASGAAERVGMTVRDTATKKVIGHLQETGATQQLVSATLGQTGGLVNPLGAATGLGALVQNEQIKGRLDMLETMLGGMQALQMATMVTAVAGIGVTVASTAIILSRLKKIDARLTELSDQIVQSDVQREDWDLGGILRKIETQLDRLAEAEVARQPEAIMDAAEAGLHENFNLLHGGVIHVSERGSIDPDMLTQLISALSVCGMAQVRALIWLNEQERAAARARRQFEKFGDLSMKLPQDVLAARLDGDGQVAQRIDGMLGEIRFRVASVPGLVDALSQQEVHGRAYLERAEAEEVEPIFLVSASN